MMEEIWKDIEGYEGIYQVSNLGRIKRLAYDVTIKMSNGREYVRHQKEMIIKTYPDSGNRYMIADLHKGKPKEHRLIHRLVAKAFVPNPDNLPEVNHKDENKRNNRADNLEWCNREYNAQYGKSANTVEQIDIHGNVVATYNSVRAAERATGIVHESISSVCRKQSMRYKAGGYRWRYKE